MLKHLLYKNFSSASNLVKKTDVCIIGSGPVGMVLSSMLNHLNISNVLIER